MNRTIPHVLSRLPLVATIATIAALAPLAACTGGEAPKAAMEEPAAGPTNRIDIPDAVRRNLGIEFARVEPRQVERTIRLPGRFELVPTARREIRAPIDGRVEILVDQYQQIEKGTPLVRITGSAWGDLEAQILATRARLESMGPVREAHRVHEASLADKVALWKDRLAQLERLREAGGGGAGQFTEAQATLNATQAELAEVMEKDAELQATERVLEAELHALQSRRSLLLAQAGCDEASAAAGGLLVCAADRGVVESLAVTPGGHVEEGELVVSIVQPDRLRFRARALQSDLDRLKAGLPARIVAANADDAGRFESVPATLAIGLSGDPDGRTIDVIASAESMGSWARAGIAASLEIVLEGGRTELAIPQRAVLLDGIVPVVFRRDPRDPNKAIRLEADLGTSDGRFIEILSGVAEGDEIVVAGNYPLMLAMSGTATKGGHFHSDGTFHAEDH
ncbi:MAG: efflux RND transporter periplasmic adaptor subunit [Phycisphaerales bacterium]